MPKFDFPSLVPELQCTDLLRTIAFYRDVLQFHIEYERPEDGFALLSRGRAWLMFEETSRLHATTDSEFVEGRQWRTGELSYPFGRGINFQIQITDVSGLYDRVKSSGWSVKVPLEERWYRQNEREIGVQQFLILDPDGYLLRFQELIGEQG